MSQIKPQNTLSPVHDQFMLEALAEAHKAYSENEVPIGAVIVKNNAVLAAAHNTCELDKSPLAHAELKAISEAAKKLGNWRFTGCSLYVTLEPCLMCLGAVFQARIDQLIIGCLDPKRINSQSSDFQSLSDKTELTDSNHTLSIITGIRETDCSQLLRDFFRKKRGK